MILQLFSKLLANNDANSSDRKTSFSNEGSERGITFLSTCIVSWIEALPDRICAKKDGLTGSLLSSAANEDLASSDNTERTSPLAEASVSVNSDSERSRVSLSVFSSVTDVDCPARNFPSVSDKEWLTVSCREWNSLDIPVFSVSVDDAFASVGILGSSDTFSGSLELCWSATAFWAAIASLTSLRASWTDSVPSEAAFNICSGSSVCDNSVRRVSLSCSDRDETVKPSQVSVKSGWVIWRHCFAKSATNEAEPFSDNAWSNTGSSPAKLFNCSVNVWIPCL